MQTVAIVGCFAAALVLTPLAARLGWKMGAVDVPRDWRRMHTDSVPRSGGIAILASVTAAFLCAGKVTPQTASGICGGLAVFLIGLADDIRPLPWAARLTVQVLAAAVGTVAVGSGGVLPAALSMFWLVAMTNAHNFIDGLDGLFAGCAAIEGGCLAVVLLLGGMGDFFLPLLISAACLGFLWHNRYPAHVFAGDCGSGAVGYLLGFAALRAFAAPAWGLGRLAPLFVFAYPLTDLSAAVLRRALRGVSPFSADRGHLHHRICAVGVPQPVCAAVLWGLCAASGICGVLLARPENALGAAISAIGMILMLVLTKRGLLRSGRQIRRDRLQS